MKPMSRAVDTNRMLLISRDENRTSQRAERRPLTALLVEVRRIEPARERPIERGPFAVDHGVPRGVTVTALVHTRLAEDALVGESEALRRRARRRVQRVALPLVAAVA